MLVGLSDGGFSGRGVRCRAVAWLLDASQGASPDCLARHGASRLVVWRITGRVAFVCVGGGFPLLTTATFGQ